MNTSETPSPEALRHAADWNDLRAQSASSAADRRRHRAQADQLRRQAETAEKANVVFLKGRDAA
jgi:hypothetical protein